MPRIGRRSFLKKSTSTLAMSGAALQTRRAHAGGLNVKFVFATIHPFRDDEQKQLLESLLSGAMDASACMRD